MTELNLIDQNKWFSSLKLAVGSKTSSSFNYITKKFNPNDNGNVHNDIKNATIAEILKTMSVGWFIREAKKEASKKNKRPKDCAKSIFSFHDYRYKQEDRDEEGHLIRHNASFIHNLGFQGFDFDPNKDVYDAEQCREIGNTLKQIIYDELHDKDWFICSTLSTGGKGAHCYTWSKVDEYIEDDDRIRWYYTNYDMKLLYMCKCLYELKKRLDWVDISKISIDPAMRRPGQTLNITVIDDEPFINYNFKYDVDYNVYEQFYYKKTTYKELSDEQLLMMPEEEQLIYKIYESYINVTKNDNTKYDKKDKNYNEHLIVKCKDYDLSKCKPYYWRHSENQDKGWTGNQVIHTLLWFFDKETVKDIWSHPNFYTDDPKDWIRFVDTWEFDDSHMPNFKLIQFLNDNCGFNLKYEHILEAKSLEEKYDHVIHLNEDEYIGTKSNEVLNAIKTGINIIIAGVGTGKTSLWINRDKELKNDVLNAGMMKSTIITEPYNAILNTKFGVGGYQCPIYKESKHLSWNSLDKGLCAANYKKLVELGNKDEIDWDNIDYIVCDESHLLTKEYFRSDDLINMIKFLKLASKNVPVVLMTGTPSDEMDIFENINTIYIDKPDKRHIEYKWIRFTPEKNTLKIWNIIAIKTLIESLVKIEKRKVYVYDGNGSLRNFKILMNSMPDIKCCIYHKRHIDDVISSDDMTYIDENHELGDKYDVILSSCYFGVGNDLNDSCDTACIIIGNHTWQEDVQVVGRWRNSMNIKTYCVINKNAEQYSAPKIKDLMIKDAEKDLIKNYNDYYNRDKNITICSSIVHIHDESSIPIIAQMLVHDPYNIPIEYKKEKLGDNYFIVDENQIAPLFWKDEDIMFGQSVIKSMKEETTNDKTQFINDLTSGKQVYWHNEDGRLLQWQKTAKFMFDHYISLFKELYIDSKWGYTNSHQDSLELFCRLSRRYNAALDEEYIDWAEIRAWHWYMTELSKVDKKTKNDEYLSSAGISYEEHLAIVSYIYMVNWTNKDSRNDKMIDGDYFIKFYYNCIAYNGMRRSMIDTLMRMNKTKIVGDDIFEMNEIVVSEYKDMNDMVHKVHDKSKVELIGMLMYKKLYYRLKNKRSIKNKESGQKGGESGGKIGKTVTITDKIKKSILKKYVLNIGDKFETQKDLANKIGKSEKTIVEWRNKGWIL